MTPLQFIRERRAQAEARVMLWSVTEELRTATIAALVGRAKRDRIAFKERLEKLCRLLGEGFRARAEEYIAAHLTLRVGHTSPSPEKSSNELPEGNLEPLLPVEWAVLSSPLREANFAAPKRWPVIGRQYPYVVINNSDKHNSKRNNDGLSGSREM
jgi:hypothetical protein